MRVDFVKEFGVYQQDPARWFRKYQENRAYPETWNKIVKDVVNAKNKAKSKSNI